MTRSVKERKAHELAQFLEFVRACDLAIVGSIEQPNPPAPDVVVDLPIGRVALELSEFDPRGSSERGRERTQDIVIAAAKKAYERAGHEPVHVWISWQSSAYLKNREALAACICELVVANPSNAEGITEVGTGFELLAPNIPITRLGIARASCGAASEWREGDMHQVGVCALENIQARITQEDVKVRRYQERYASHWLVLITGAAGPSTWGVFVDRSRHNEYKSCYDRVFLLEQDRNRCHELKLSRTG